MENKIYVVTHKKFKLSTFLKDKGYELFTVGGKEIEDGVNDAQGETIYKKNLNYCELTGVYWIWKNIDTDIKGFCHYRRYFTKDTIKFDENKLLSIKEIDSILSEHPKAVIVPEKKYYNISAKKLYLRCGFQKDLDATRDVISEKYPEYLNIYDKMMNSNFGYITNMMIAKKNVFDEYCKWVFDILFSVEKRTDLSGYSTAEARIYGYISERLLGVWLEKNKIETIEFQSINPETDFGIRYLLYRMSVKLRIYKYLKYIAFLWNNRVKNGKNKKN